MKETIKNNYVKILFIIIMIVGIIIRAYNFPKGIREINIDEVLTTLNAKSIADTGKDLDGQTFPTYIQGIGGQSVVLTYLMAISMKLLGYTLFAARLPSLIISIIAMALFYDLIKKLTKNKNIALIGLAILAISPWHILQSMWAWDCNMFPHFLLFAIDILYTAILKNKKMLLYISMVFFGITLYCYGIAIYFVPLFLIVQAIYLLKEKRVKPLDVIISIIIFLIISIPIILTFVINALKIDIDLKIFNITIPYYENLGRTTDMLLFSSNIPLQLIENILYLLFTIILQNDDVIWNTTKIFGTIYHITTVFSILGIILYKNKKETNSNDKKSFIIYSWLIVSIVTGIFVNETTVNRLNSIWYVLIIFASIGIYEVYNKIKEIDSKKVNIFKYSYIGLIIIIYLSLFISYIIYFYTVQREQIESSKFFSSEGYQKIVENEGMELIKGYDILDE